MDLVIKFLIYVYVMELTTYDIPETENDYEEVLEKIISSSHYFKSFVKLNK